MRACQPVGSAQSLLRVSDYAPVRRARGGFASMDTKFYVSEC